MICLDSSFIIDCLENDQSAKKIYEKYKNEILYIAETSIFEVGRGAIFSDSKNKTFPHKFNIFIDLISELQILPSLNLHSLESAKISAELALKGIQIDDGDCMIAGLMKLNGISKIITRNKKHFSKIKGIQALNY